MKKLLAALVLGLALTACAGDPAPAPAADPPAGGSTAFLDAYQEWLGGGPLPPTDVPAPKDVSDLMLGGN